MVAKKNTVFHAFILMVSSVFLSCSHQNSDSLNFKSKESSLQAVEVGNPEDSGPKNPKKNPMHLVQVEMQASELEEISKIEFAIESILLLNSVSPQLTYEIATQSLEKFSNLVLTKNSKHVFEFMVPKSAFENRSSLELSFRFSREKTSHVWVGESRYPIEGRPESISFSMAESLQKKISEESVVIAPVITKASLFEPVLEPIISSSVLAGASSTTSSGQDKSPPRAPVYRLKDTSH